MYVPNADARTDRVQAGVIVRGRVRSIDWNRDWANGHSVRSDPCPLSPPLFNQLLQPPLGCANWPTECMKIVYERCQCVCGVCACVYYTLCVFGSVVCLNFNWFLMCMPRMWMQQGAAGRQHCKRDACGRHTHTDTRTHTCSWSVSKINNHMGHYAGVAVLH